MSNVTNGVMVTYETPCLAGLDKGHIGAITQHIQTVYASTYYVGPIQNTIEDFWEMVWEQKSPMIIMLTRLVEGTKVRKSVSFTCT